MIREHPIRASLNSLTTADVTLSLEPQIAEELRMTSTPLRQPLRPLILDLDPVSPLLIDSENSLWHGKIYLSLGPNPSANASTIH